MDRESKYWRMISKDSTVLLFNSLYDDCLKTNNAIASTHMDIYSRCNKGFSNLLSGSRFLKKTNRSSGDDYIGFGNKGFGTSNYPSGNLYYNYRSLVDYKDIILNERNVFKNHVKKSSQYKNMFDITINALKKIPNLHPIKQYVPFDIKRSSYSDNKEIYTGIRTTSPFGRYNRRFEIELIGKAKDVSYYNYSLTSNDVRQDVELYHAYDDSSKLLKKHLVELKLLENEFKKYIKSKAYLKLKDELDILEVTKTI